MAVLALVCLGLGVVCGLWVFEGETSLWLIGHSELVLSLLMFSVGISVGMGKDVLRKLRSYHPQILLLPLGITVASAAAGFLCWPLPGLSLAEKVSITSGMGWYSLTGVMLSGLAGARAGAVGFLANLLRELLAFLTIPWIARHLDRYTAIAPAGATSEDTTLAILLRCTTEEMVVPAVMNGVLCSAAVPFLIRFFYSVLS